MIVLHTYYLQQLTPVLEALTASSGDDVAQYCGITQVSRLTGTV